MLGVPAAAVALLVPAAAAFALLLAACGQSTPSPSPTFLRATVAPATAAPTGSPAASLAASGSAPVVPTGFAFDAESVLGYYRSIGYTCAAPVPSTQAAGYLFTSCQLVDPEGRTRLIGLVTDPGGELADGFASVRGRAGEAFLEPTVALEPLAGFLGAMLGEERGTALVPWLAGHLGDEFAETTAGDLHVATYAKQEAGRMVLFVEVANDAYIESPRPSASTRPS